MTVDAIMTTDIVKLAPADTVSHGLRVMHEQHVRTLPVVNDNGRFLGLFGIRQVIHLLLPNAAQIEFGLTNLSFMPDELGELYHRLRDVGQRPVAEFLEDAEDVLVCEPTTPLPKVLELLHQSFNTRLPIVVLDGEDDQLVGIVTSWDVLEKLVMNVFGDIVEQT